ncbi:tyrosine-protein phosphatase corkscrew-like [Hydractinia symbiolongicarpus]|uniref:tyrosine-protein phosphatase corkscrew-like n=1 Tax=Hydractinia symbiolongicarpus TaxID=13093 RepID=UPI00254CAD68|nr:tyrosine-protein phosphatase corkscrew-like [Hydractinia symbiolongicarpus]
MRSSWGFHAQLTFDEAEKILKEKGANGNYLCRRSATTPGSYTLSVKRGNVVWHFKIRNDGDCFELYENDGFASVPDLIEYYQQNPSKFIDADGNCVQMSEPVAYDDDSDPGLDKERWFFGEIGRGEAHSFLKQRGEDGSYLVRESRSKPGSYVLSIRHKNEVTEFLIEYTDGTFDVSGTKSLKFPTMQHLLNHFTAHPPMDVHGNVVPLKEALCDTAERRKNDQRMKKEFEWLQQEDRANTNTKSEGLKPENRGKNRYRNILPFDHTRVVLRNVDPNISGSDYINASYIFDDESGALFIASQGCVKATVNDFWHMIDQENSRIIIMVTNEVEKAKIKCVRYWPEPGVSMNVGKKIVTNTGETATRDYVVRQLELSDELHGNQPTPPRKIFLYQFVGWPDHGVPGDPGSLLEVMQLIEATQKTFEYPGPPVIHCSAGIGRTGTVIVISMLMSLYRIKGHLEERDVPRTVQKVRLQRSGMVQTEAQYRFIYNAVVFFMETVERREVGAQQSRNLYGNLDAMSELLSDLTGDQEDLPPPPPRSTKASMKSKPVPKPN